MKVEKESFGKVTVIMHSTFEQAQITAYQDSASTGGFTFPIVVAKQGKRLFLSGALPIKFIETRLIAKAADKRAGMSDAKSASNRPYEAKHAMEIAKYLKDNLDGKYIIPSLTLNVQENVNVYTIASGGNFKAGYLAVPIDVVFSVTDGQHRLRGIVEALADLDKTNPAAAKNLREDSVSVMITCEHELPQIHQDFADCSKTKALPPSLLSVFDTRNPANRILADVVSLCPLFTGKIDSTSKSLSKTSPHLFLANQVRQLIKHLLVRGNPADADFEKRANDHLGDPKGYKLYLDKYVAFINRVTQTIPVYREIAEINPATPKKGLIAKYRSEDWVCLTATGLNVLGSIGYELITNEINDWESYVDRLADVNWKKAAKIWEGNIIQNGKVITQSGPIRSATARVMQVIGLNDFLERDSVIVPDEEV